MGKIGVLITLGVPLVLGGCSMPPKWIVPDDTHVGQFADVTNAKEFWISQAKFEIKAQGGPQYDEAAYNAYWDCAGKKMVEISPPHLNATIEKFAHSHLYADYYDAVDEAQGFLADYKRANGAEAVQVVRAYCKGKTGA